MKRISILLAALAAAPPLAAQTLLTVDATRPTPAATTGYLKTGTRTGPNGTIDVTTRYLTKDGRPWIPVMGEFHFSRYPADEWEAELLKMKASGVGIVSSYIIWNQIELAPGRLDWSGNRDLRRFVRLCAKHGLLFFARPGPWVHGETRLGGLPDWVVAQGRTRTDDPVYMTNVTRFWTALGAQLQGLMWKDGGPIVGVQIENEYVETGPGRGAEHIATLKALALRVGLDVPLYTVTGWGRASYPRGEVAPVVGAYPDEPWAKSTGILPPRDSFVFRYNREVGGTLGAQAVGSGSGLSDMAKDIVLTPYLGAEYGPGAPIMYRRRPIIAPDDIGATITTQLGSGLNLLGYYMYHNGANPMVAGRTLQESTLSGGDNDMPIVSYDFQAPLGSYGEVGAVSAKLRPLHYFLDDFGAALAPMTTRLPALLPGALDDLATPRFAVRSAGDSGYLFVNNHVRQHAMAAQRDVRFAVALPGGTLRLPSRAVTIADHEYFLWPFGLDLDGVRLAWASAQPVARLEDDAGPLYVFKATDGIPAEFAFDAATRLSLPGRRADDRRIADLRPSRDRILTVSAPGGRSVRILLLSQADTDRLWIGEFGGRRRMILTDADLFVEADRLVLRQRGKPAFRFAMWPAIGGLRAAVPLRTKRGVLTHYAADLPSVTLPAIRAVRIRDAEEAPPILIGGANTVAMQPAPEAFAAAAAWRIDGPRTIPGGAVNAWMEIAYRGDIARLFAGDRLLDDAFWDGRVWKIGLQRFAADLGTPWMLTLLPLRGDAPIYLAEGHAAKPAIGTQIATLDSIKIVPEYELRVMAR